MISTNFINDFIFLYNIFAFIETGELNENLLFFDQGEENITKRKFFIKTTKTMFSYFSCKFDNHLTRLERSLGDRILSN